jgi:hypothetical protein
MINTPTRHTPTHRTLCGLRLALLQEARLDWHPLGLILACALVFNVDLGPQLQLNLSCILALSVLDLPAKAVDTPC